MGLHVAELPRKVSIRDEAKCQHEFESKCVFIILFRCVGWLAAWLALGSSRIAMDFPRSAFDGSLCFFFRFSKLAVVGNC